MDAFFLFLIGGNDVEEIQLQGVTYRTPVGRELFCKMNFNFKAEKIGIIGRNGVGKSTLLKLIVGELLPKEGQIKRGSSLITYVPQVITPITEEEVKEKKRVIVERIHNHIKDGEQRKLLLSQKILMDKETSLSGGEQKIVWILDAFSMDSDFILMDEPECSLDRENRKMIKKWIQRSKKGILLVSHDRDILNEMDYIVEIREQGMRSFRGNYENYRKITLRERNTLEQKIKEQITEIKELDKQKEKVVNRQRFRMEKGADDIADKRYGDFWCDTPKKDRAGKTLKKLKKKQEEKKREGEKLLKDYMKNVTLENRYHIPLTQVEVNPDKDILELCNVSFAYEKGKEIICNFSLCIKQGEKVAIIGKNGIGKTTLLNIMQGKGKAEGFINREWNVSACLDQFHLIVNMELNVIENIMTYNHLTDRERMEGYVREVGFPLEIAKRKCKSLSGGERMVTALLMLLFGKIAPDILFLDEPTNHLDIQSMVILENMINNYLGTVVLVSHDESFLNKICLLRKVFL